MSPARIVSLGHAVPGVMDQKALWRGHFADHYGNDARAERLWLSAGVERRHGVVDPCQEDVSGWSTGSRMQRYLTEALPLGKEAVAAALSNSDLDATDVGLFTVASCTGYATPGLDILLARDLGMSEQVQRLFVGHMGCYAAIPALGSTADFVRSRGRAAAVLCCELTSLHVQPPDAAVTEGGRLTRAGLQQLAAHSLFADASASMVLSPDLPGLEVVDIDALTDVTTSELMTWDITDLGFRMGLSPRVADVLSRHVGPMVGALLARHGLAVPDVAGWVVHPGGPRILDVVGDRVGLTADALAPSYDVLRDYGNCSSATVLLVLERLLAAAPPAAGEVVVMLAFGPGLTLYAALLRQTD